jgi:branched-chain amino acid transport system ATP-binding protein
MAEFIYTMKKARKAHGDKVILDDVTIMFYPGAKIGVVGPNGAGKTTLFNCLSRLYEYQEGDLLFDGKSITQTPVHEVANTGIGRTFQNLAMFKTMNVIENIMVGAHSKSKTGFIGGLLPNAKTRAEEEDLRSRADDLIVRLKLTDVAKRPVGDLPFGFQKRVEFARALASQPRLLLLDEPAAGLNHAELGDLADLIKQVRDEMGISVLLVEHHMHLVMNVSDWIVALNFGRKIAEGTPEQIQKHPEVIRAYLGGA